jgi:hypothetical protein
MTKAVLVHARNPLVPTDMRHARTVDLPVKLSALVEQCYEASGPGRRVVSVNGEYVLPVHGDREICARDIVVVEDVFEGGAGGKGSLRLVLMMAAVYFLGPGGALGFSPIQGLIAVTVANMLIMSLIPPPKPQKNGPQEQPTATYSTSLSGNQARLDGVIPVGYGYMRSFPDFAAQPYTQYENNEQDYFALLCVGKGKYTIEHIEIDDTEIDHFIGVQKNVVEPGQPLTLVLGNVATALEVSGQELIAGKWVGPITACKANSTVSSIGVDIVLNGLGTQNGTSMANASVRVRFDIREIDHNGVPVDGALWETAIDQTINGASASQVRHSFYYYLPSPKRIQVRGGRVDAKIDTIETANTPTWGALRAYLAEPATLDPASTYIEIKMRATDQLNGLSQRRIAVKWQRLLKQWTPELGWAAEEVPTRSIAWALADIASSNNPSYAGNMGDNRLDLQTGLHVHARPGADAAGGHVHAAQHEARQLQDPLHPADERDARRSGRALLLERHLEVGEGPLQRARHHQRCAAAGGDARRRVWRQAGRARGPVHGRRPLLPSALPAVDKPARRAAARLRLARACRARRRRLGAGRRHRRLRRRHADAEAERAARVGRRHLLHSAAPRQRRADRPAARGSRPGAGRGHPA